MSEMLCMQCESLIRDEPIKIVDFKANSPFSQDICHFEDGYRCTWNGTESLRLEDLPKNGCRCRR